ncbi:uncharacterized protein BT62DRAFT_733657 [Guyanagaster necrorhizus]|uniref:Uncharacterized protein n=1 Tax=Guyanagaster necrorhizus TaxID=856835 RepID=A0A9P7VX70_9AGAR|nr:uncharacterized protein BT62DRAFT_733657 [Guyanagaster necrorhizus MCA 3950]KAG7448903.1 hypothetical protein BT62DRAFT_733657 [Guyanagaster necrorhizus MCA 3950]
MVGDGQVSVLVAPIAPFRPGWLWIIIEPNNSVQTWPNVILVFLILPRPYLGKSLYCCWGQILRILQHKMMTHQTLYTLANALGILAMATVIGYHVVAVNSKYLSKNAQSKL